MKQNFFHALVFLMQSVLGSATGGAPDSPMPVWVEMNRDAIFLGKVMDFEGHGAAAFHVSDSEGVLYLDLKLEKPTKEDEFVPAPRVSSLPKGLKAGAAGKVRYYGVEKKGRPEFIYPGNPENVLGGAFLGFEPFKGSSVSVVPKNIESLALLAVVGPSSTVQTFRDRFKNSNSDTQTLALRALLWARSKPVLREVLSSPSPPLAPANWIAMAQTYANGLDKLSGLSVPGRPGLALLSAAVEEWKKKPDAEAATLAATSLVGTEFNGWDFEKPGSTHYNNIEARVEPRLGPFNRESINWFGLLSESSPDFSKQVLAQLPALSGETGLWIEELNTKSNSISIYGRGTMSLEKGAVIPVGISFGSRVSMVFRGLRTIPESRRILAVKLEINDPAALTSEILKKADGRTIGMLAKVRAMGNNVLPADWTSRLGSLADFSQLEALAQCRDTIFLGELESLLPRTLVEARHRMDTESIRQPIVIALGWIAAGSYARAYKLLMDTPELIRKHGVPYSEGKLSSYQQSLIESSLWLANRLEKPGIKQPAFPEFAGSEFLTWVRDIDPSLLKKAGLKTPR